MNRERWILVEAADQCGLEPETMLRFVSLAWISPVDPEQIEFDAEDIARARLICELQRDFDVNDAAIPLVLHLLDQLHYLRRGPRLQ